MPVLDRLAGLETEYAIRFHPEYSASEPPSKYSLYQSLVGALRLRQPTAEAKHFKLGLFTANGGAVWFEAERPASGGGLIEGATPECRGPRQLVTYQRAQDTLLAEATESAGTFGRFSLLKNDRDHLGNIYGAQENYEVTLATGWRLAAWRLGLVLLSPLVLLTGGVLLLVILGLLLYLGVAWLFYLPFRRVDRSRRLALGLFGRDLVEGRDTGSPTPPWLEGLLVWVMRLFTAPVAVALWLLMRLTSYARIRRELVPLLMSRAIVSGSGMVADDGRFVLSDKALAINSVLGYGGFFHERPLFVIGHFFKLLCAEAFFSPRDFMDLFARQQRLQIGLGDSNMAQVAEYLRVGTTMLVLDVIEAGAMPPVPRFRRAIRGLHEFVRDPSLEATVRDTRGHAWTALDLQRFYLRACREFLERRVDATPEAWELLEYWSETLNGLDELRQTGRPPTRLIGAVDWVTKQYLLDEAGPDASWEQRKKIDLRYHELSPEGYFALLKRTGTVPEVVPADEVERATRTAPADTPATMRARYIREFNDGSSRLRASWKAVFIGNGVRPKAIRLARYGRGGAL